MTSSIPTSRDDRQNWGVNAGTMFVCSESPLPLQPEPQTSQKESKTGAETNLTQPLNKCLKQCNYIIISKNSFSKIQKKNRRRRRRSNKWDLVPKSHRTSEESTDKNKRQGLHRGLRNLAANLTREAGLNSGWLTTLVSPSPPSLICWLGMRWKRFSRLLINPLSSQIASSLDAVWL